MKSDDDKDQHSYQTCSSGHNVVHSALFDSADSARFPQGDISPYVVNDPKFRQTIMDNDDLRIRSCQCKW